MSVLVWVITDARSVLLPVLGETSLIQSTNREVQDGEFVDYMAAVKNETEGNPQRGRKEPPVKPGGL